MRKQIYRRLQQDILKKWVLPRMASDKWNELHKTSSIENVEKFSNKSGPRAWFHASSVGELEALWNVILDWNSKEQEFVVTGFSESIEGSFKKLAKELSSKKSHCLFIGFSPWEGNWMDQIQKVMPDVFVTAKYEAWPDLWISLSELNVPLVTVAAKARRSLKFAKVATNILGADLPSMVFCLAEESDHKEIKDWFPKSKISVAGDPRWDRVWYRAMMTRASNSFQRASEIGSFVKEQIAFFPRPWGIFGSVDEKDLEILTGWLKKAEGSVWVVPHRLDETSLSAVENWIQNEGFSPVRSSKIKVSNGNSLDLNGQSSYCLLIDEIGFLLELYAYADWAYVGGGFSEGVHNTMEPSVYGIPIAVGPRNAETFSEISDLCGTGQLTLCHDKNEFDDWMKNQRDKKQTKEIEWKADTKARLGATARVMIALSELLGQTAKVKSGN